MTQLKNVSFQFDNSFIPGFNLGSATSNWSTISITYRLLWSTAPNPAAGPDWHGLLWRGETTIRSPVIQCQPSVVEVPSGLQNPLKFYVYLLQQLYYTKLQNQTIALTIGGGSEPFPHRSRHKRAIYPGWDGSSSKHTKMYRLKGRHYRQLRGTNWTKSTCI